MCQYNSRLKKNITYLFTFLFASGVFTLISCNNNNSGSNDTRREESKPISTPVKKPASTYHDTLTIAVSAAVFFHPDTFQLIKIKAQTDSSVFDGSMHEFFYQMRNARKVIQKTWPALSIVEAKNYRFLRFVKEDKTHDYIDLDSINDAFGLFVFDGRKTPLLTDMTNIETAVSFYLSPDNR